MIKVFLSVISVLIPDLATDNQRESLSLYIHIDIFCVVVS